MSNSDLSHVVVVVVEAEVPGDAGAGGHSPELVDDVPGNEVDVIVVKTEVGVAHAITSQLVQLGLFHPLATLQ